jgi:hypothetical protein
MRWIAGLVLCASGCRFAFDPPAEPPIDAPIDASTIDPATMGLCDDATDVNVNGIPDLCDPCAASTPPDGCSTHGVPIDGLPSHPERVFLIGMNALRADPIGYRDTYMVFGDGTGANVFATDPPSAPLVAYNHRITSGSHAQTADRVVCGGTEPPYIDGLCDGTTFDTWAAAHQPIAGRLYYHLGPYAMTPELPIRLFGAFVCLGPIEYVTYASRLCQTDAARDLFVNPVHRTFGPGIGYYDPITYSIWAILVDDQAPAFAFPAPTGGHFVFGTDIHYALNVETAAAPRGAYAVIDGVRTDMTLALGSPTRGMFRVVEPAAACKSYYFLLVDGDGAIWRYPAAGSLRTTIYGTCDEDWVP